MDFGFGPLTFIARNVMKPLFTLPHAIGQLHEMQRLGALPHRYVKLAGGIVLFVTSSSFLVAYARRSVGPFVKLLKVFLKSYLNHITPPDHLCLTDAVVYVQWHS